MRRAREILRELEEGQPSPAPKKAAPKESAQASLADLGASDLVRRIRALDLDELTPVQALNTLYELRTVAEKLP